MSKRAIASSRGEQVGVGAVGPAHDGQEVEHRLRQVAGLAVFPDEGQQLLVPLGPLLAFAQLAHAAGIQDQRHVRVDRHLPAERAVEVHVQRHAADPLVPAQDVRDRHEVVIDDVREVVGREAVRFDQDRIAHLAVVPRLELADDVHERRLAFQGHGEAHHRGGARRFQFSAGLRGQGAAVPVVALRLILARGLLAAQRIQPLLGAVAAVRVALPDQRSRSTR